MLPKASFAMHRKRPARCEGEGDPPSPVVFGLGMVFFRGAELYRQEARNEETLRRFGHGTPDDWVERNIYSRYTLLGIMIMLAIDLALFGLVGLAVWAVQDRKSTRLNSSHVAISYAVFCLKKKRNR